MNRLQTSVQRLRIFGIPQTNPQLADKIMEGYIPPLLPISDKERVLKEIAIVSLPHYSIIIRRIFIDNGGKIEEARKRPIGILKALDFEKGIFWVTINAEYIPIDENDSHVLEAYEKIKQCEQPKDITHPPLDLRRYIDSIWR
jgi:hypothetical protein